MPKAMTRPVPASDDHAIIGRKMREKRVAANVSVMKLARALNVSVNTVRWHEAGARLLRADDLVIAASVLGCKPSDLIDPENADAAVNVS